MMAKKDGGILQNSSNKVKALIARLKQFWMSHKGNVY